MGKKGIAGRMERRYNCTNSEEGGREGIKEYRGVTLMLTMYKIYTTALAERLSKETEEKIIIPHNETGFREGMGTIYTS